MGTRLHHKAFTITELALVVSGAGLLATIVLPLPQQLRQRQRLTGCLDNLSRIGAASLAYATQDPRSQVTPMHTADVTDLMLYAGGFHGPWGWRTVTAHVFGGQTATRPFPSGGAEYTAMLDEAWAPQPNPWGAATRGLNPLVVAGGGSLETFHCPADAGYPLALGYDIPTEAAGICCFEMLGNSYRSNRCGVVLAGGGGGEGGSLPLAAETFATSPFGHTPEHVLDPRRTVLYSDPLFYSAVRELATEGSMDPIVGWHGLLMADNVAYCDGSARLTEIGTFRQFSGQELQSMLVNDYLPGSFLRRGPTWQMDCYPAPLVRTVTYSLSSHDPMPTSRPTDHGWPYDRYIETPGPFGPSRDLRYRSDPVPPERQPDRWMAQ